MVILSCGVVKKGRGLIILRSPRRHAPHVQPHNGRPAVDLSEEFANQPVILAPDIKGLAVCPQLLHSQVIDAIFKYHQVCISIYLQIAVYLRRQSVATYLRNSMMTRQTVDAFGGVV